MTYARSWLMLVPLVLLLPLAVSAQRYVGDVVAPSRRGAPRASSGRIGAQIVVGALAAGTLGYAAWTFVDNPEGADRRVKGDAGYTPNANTAYAVGSFFGSVVAVSLIGRGDGSRGSFGATVLGAALATIPLALGRHEPYLPLFGIVLGAPAQALGATVAYQLTRRER